MLPAYQGTTKRKPVATAKFYFFDVGVANVLRNTLTIEEGSEAFGHALEHQVFLELKAYLDYRQLDLPLTHWRTHSQHEVDFVIGDDIAIEVKANARITQRHLRGLMALKEERPIKHALVVCGESTRRRTDEGVLVIPMADFFQALWRNEWMLDT